MGDRGDVPQRAAELSTDPERGAERRLAAAEAWLLAGNPTEAAALADQAAPSLGTALGKARAKRVRAASLRASGRSADAVVLLMEASREMAPSDPRLARDTLLQAVLPPRARVFSVRRPGRCCLRPLGHCPDRPRRRPATCCLTDT